MFKKTMTFEDLEGNERTETFYFNYTKLEVAEMLELQQLEEKIKSLTIGTDESGLSELENTKQAYDTFRELILGAYGEKGSDNVTFVKNDRTREYMESHVAFVELIIEFINNPSLAGEFMEKCLPAKMVAAAKKELANKPDVETLVAEAARRQEDPATRVEPGLENLPDEVRTLPNEQLQKQAKPIGDLNSVDIAKMSDDEFKKIDVRQLNKEALMAAFSRKSNG